MDELDQMDVNRWLRSLEAKRLLTVERKRAAWLRGVLKSEDLSREEWDMIREHDAMVDDG